MKGAEEVTNRVAELLGKASPRILVDHTSTTHYANIQKDRQLQIQACQTLQKGGWKIHACALSLFGYEAVFTIRATLHATEEAERHQQAAYQKWKNYSTRYGYVFE